MTDVQTNCSKDNIPQEKLTIPKLLQSLINYPTAKHYSVAPLFTKGEVIHVAAPVGNDGGVAEVLRFISGLRIRLIPMAKEEIEKLIERDYPAQDKTMVMGPQAQDVRAFAMLDLSRFISKTTLLNIPDSSDVVEVVNNIIGNALYKKASDIHFEPFEDKMIIRFRLDGMLHEMIRLPEKRQAEIISRLKIMAQMDITERRRPQDGRMQVSFGNETIDVRVSTLPTSYGEKMVLRLLNNRKAPLSLSELGFDDKRLTAFHKCIKAPYGMILVTGPTGAGKTTTLYSCLNHIKAPAVNISTIEDPIEYKMEGINQSQVKADIGYDFAAALRTLLRQDPNVIMVGEIRDRETAEIAIRAALTGHLVFSTLHTNDAVSAIARLIDMGIEPFLLSSALSLIVAQRLVRRICPSCKQPAILSHDLLSEQDFKGLNAFEGKGCAECNETGFSGRIGLFEVLPVSEALRGMITGKAPIKELKRQAIEEGLVTLRMDGVKKVASGKTALGEILRETFEQ
ncbi:MAG: hypothetical protein A2293_12335 [Elusimicrobia bacterium RIFOXYB2_FULL_49_7]|nr:MAG: hypothetical protein A2293_12335 [Elusimicrobia bacterium RIFOXYB2_FULL_49_7]